MKKRAIISVSDKTGVADFAKGLYELGYEIVSTGGTHKVIEAAGVPVVGISDVTGFPECLDGRVKTMHPNISAGILAMRKNPEHMRQIEELGINTIDIVVINLYPFKATILKEGTTFEEAIENIDIGGPTMIRAAAKNWQDVAVLVDARDYDTVLSQLRENGEVSLETKRYLAAKVFEHTSHYDTLISNYLKKQLGDESFPELLTLTYEKAQEMRYGENPHQKAAFYKEVGFPKNSIAAAVQHHGKELSYNNISDASAAVELVKEFSEPCAVAVKHANPCGVGLGDTIAEAYKNAYEADPVSIFGGILALNREVDAETAAEAAKIFLEIIIAPSYTKEAMDILTAKKNLRIMSLPAITDKTAPGTLETKKVSGGLLIQSADTEIYNDDDLKVVTKAQPTAEQLSQMKFAMKIVKHTKSNAIVLVKGKRSAGVGPGQTNRITSLGIAIDYAGENAKGSVMASDAFFPFDDCVEAAHKAGVAAIIQPGGSIRDNDSIKKCDEYGIPMVFTGMRHFKH
ncbi:MAG: bifunctional phosphoribosylaminoimidazolecarboxamide formyltransferase/IMP cyclohydrolase [Clostridia bacterium]|nr:bifunctional phosphoribosylaminoimidazolecarboxamide formyltransferase/IMP cyclohydrolase [Clostridia bacterium]